MRGRHLGGAVDHDWLALRRLLAAVVALAARDAAAGDQEAADFLDASGGLAEVLGLRRDAFAGWRACNPDVYRATRRAAKGTSDEAIRRSRQRAAAKKKAKRAAQREAKQAALDQESEVDKC